MAQVGHDRQMTHDMSGNDHIYIYPYMTSEDSKQSAIKPPQMPGLCYFFLL